MGDLEIVEALPEPWGRKRPAFDIQRSISKALPFGASLGVRCCMPTVPLVHTPLFTTGEKALLHLHFAPETIRFTMGISFA
jgi:hypothetical protein